MENMPQPEDEAFEALRHKNVDDMSPDELLDARRILHDRRMKLQAERDAHPDDEEIREQSAEAEGMFADAQYKLEGVDDAE